MIRQPTETLADLYLADETAWLDTMAGLIGEKRLDELDYAHLKEFLEDNARRDRWEIYCKLADYLAGALLWTYRRDKLTPTRRAEILHSGFELENWLDTPTLQKHANTILHETYTDAIACVCAEVESPPTAFPPRCPWTLDQLLSAEVLAE